MTRTIFVTCAAFFLTAACGAAHPTPSAPSRALTEEGVATGTAPPGDPISMSTGSCGGLADLAREDRPLLARRIHLALPTDASVQSASRSIMAAETSHEREEVAWVEHGDARMAVVVNEWLVRETGPLADAVRAHSPTGWTLAGDGDLVVASPDVVRASGTDAVLGIAWWRDAAGALVRVSIVTDPRNAARGGCVALTHEILASLTAGDRTLELGARTVALEGGIVLDVPEGYASALDDGDDFVVHRFESVGPWSAPTASAGIYFGSYPSFAPSADLGPVDTLLGQPVQWYDRHEDGAHHREAMIGPRMHVFFSASDEGAFDALYAAMRTLRSTAP